MKRVAIPSLLLLAANPALQRFRNLTPIAGAACAAIGIGLVAGII